jgi:2-methylcitrate dehydratase PrpD
MNQPLPPSKLASALPITELLAGFASSLSWHDLPKQVRTEAKLAIADTVGGAIAACREPIARSVLEVVNGTTGPSRIWGTGASSNASNAALVNGTLAHTHDIDDTHPAMRGHPSSPVVAATFALAPEAHADGKEIIAAYVAGVEIETKLGRGINMTHYNRGWHTTLTLGTLGATAAAARLLKLDRAATVNALSIGASSAGGLVANFGTPTKPVHAGFAARNGVMAAQLARAGISGNPRAIEGKNGFFDLFCGRENANPVAVVEALGERFELVDPGNVYKQYPTCSLTHCAIDMILDGVASGAIEPAKILRVECGVGYRSENTLPYHRPANGLEGKFSMEYCLAAALVYGRVTFDEFQDEKVMSPAIAELYKKIYLYIHPDLRTPESVDRDFTDLVIIHSDGRRFHGREQKAKGDPTKRWSLAEFKAKFTRCASPYVGASAAERYWEDTYRLEQLTSEQVAALY